MKRTKTDHYIDDARVFVLHKYEELIEKEIITCSVDKLPYSEDFEILYERIHGNYHITRREVFLILLTWRKAGGMKRTKRGTNA